MGLKLDHLKTTMDYITSSEYNYIISLLSVVIITLSIHISTFSSPRGSSYITNSIIYRSYTSIIYIIITHCVLITMKIYYKGNNTAINYIFSEIMSLPPSPQLHIILLTAIHTTLKIMSYPLNNIIYTIIKKKNVSDPGKPLDQGEQPRV